MSSKEYMIQRISEYSNDYFEEYLKEWKKELMLKNWWGGMKLLLDHSYYQGRRDIVSKRVKDEVFKVLNNYIDDKKELKVILSEKTIKQIENDLRKVIGKGKIGKGRDVEMTLEILNFPKEKSEQNITKYSITEIKNGKIKELAKDLMKIKGIGPKISSFYLIDLVTIHSLEEDLNEDDLVLLQPVDAWVRKVAKEIKIITEKEKKDTEICRKIVEECSKNKISPLKFNQGAWYLGFHSLDLLLNILGES